MANASARGGNINFEEYSESPKWLFPVLIGGGVIVILGLIWLLSSKSK